MEAVIFRQFRMERSCQQAALACSHDASIRKPGQYFSIPLHCFDQRRSDEYCVEILPIHTQRAQAGYVQVGFKAGNLPSKSIALDGNIHQA